MVFWVCGTTAGIIHGYALFGEDYFSMFIMESNYFDDPAHQADYILFIIIFACIQAIVMRKWSHSWNKKFETDKHHGESNLPLSQSIEGAKKLRDKDGEDMEKAYKRGAISDLHNPWVSGSIVGGGVASFFEAKDPKDNNTQDGDFVRYVKQAFDVDAIDDKIK